MTEAVRRAPCDPTHPLAHLYPGYFAAVMATGIVSVGLFLLGQGPLSAAFWAVAGLLYLVLWGAYGLRLIRFPQLFLRDLTDPSRMFTFFTVSAGSDVLGARCLLGHWVGLALILGAIGTAVWLGLMYGELVILVVGDPVPRLEAVNGGWLIAVVAAQSVASLAAAAVQALPVQAALLSLTGLAFWSVGVVLYGILMVGITARLTFRRVRADDLQPPYWINMGATAITTLAGSRLYLAGGAVALLQAVRPFVEGLTFGLWAWGSWWIPFLVAVGAWKYGVVREPIRYQPAQWSIIFPLGMYGAATLTLAHLPGLAEVGGLGRGFVWLAVGAWLALAALCLRDLSLRGRSAA